MARVLVVDDDATIRRVLEAILRLDGHEVLQAENGLAGLAAARLHLPDLMLLDLMMPELDGWGVLAARQAEPALAAIPTVVVSAIAEVTAVDWTTWGVWTALSKPFRASDVLRILAEILR